MRKILCSPSFSIRFGSCEVRHLNLALEVTRLGQFKGRCCVTKINNIKNFPLNKKQTQNVSGELKPYDAPEALLTHKKWKKNKFKKSQCKLNRYTRAKTVVRFLNKKQNKLSKFYNRCQRKTKKEPIQRSETLLVESALMNSTSSTVIETF